MEYGIRGKVALVGGGSRGIGRAIAGALAREGARVAICARDGEVLRRTAAELSATSGGEIAAIEADLSKAGGVAHALEGAHAQLGDIDILIVNTGGPRPGRFIDLVETDWDAAYDLLLKSALRLIWGALPGMKKRKWGRIIGITSVAVKEPIENLVLSNVFRTGVTALFKGLAREVAADGITVNTVLPGLTNTDRLRMLYAAQAKSQRVSTEEFLSQAAGGTPRKVLNDPEELAALVAFLTSEAASGISGCAIPADGAQLRSVM